jgi:membrane fusion protein (multidrug efflux system)
LGTTQPLPNQSARISAVVEGRVLSVLGDGKKSSVVEGQEVKPDQIIVQLDDRVQRANRDKLQATLNDLEEQHKQAGFALELATIDVSRLKELLKSSEGSQPLVSPVDFEKAKLLRKDAQSKLQGIIAKQSAAKADLKALDQQLEFYTLRAPIAGRLGIVQAVPGQTLTPGAVVADVVNLERIDALCYAPPQAASKLVLAQKAKLLLEEANAVKTKKPLEGEVVFIAAQADPQTGNIAVKVRFPNPDLQVRANSVVRVFVLTKPEKERLTIPENALMEDQERATVLVVENEKVRKLYATVEIRDRDRHVVVVRLQDPDTQKAIAPAGLLFVTKGGNGLENGDEVRLEKEGK